MSRFRKKLRKALSEQADNAVGEDPQYRYQSDENNDNCCSDSEYCSDHDVGFLYSDRCQAPHDNLDDTTTISPSTTLGPMLFPRRINSCQSNCQVNKDRINVYDDHEVHAAADDNDEVYADNDDKDDDDEGDDDDDDEFHAEGNDGNEGDDDDGDDYDDDIDYDDMDYDDDDDENDVVHHANRKRQPTIYVEGSSAYVRVLERLGMYKFFNKKIRKDVYRSSPSNSRAIVDRVACFLAFTFGTETKVDEQFVINCLKKVAYKNHSSVTAYGEYLLNREYAPSEFSLVIFYIFL
jgi:hypothetical protein